MPDQQGNITKAELEAVVDHLYELSEAALQDNSREELRSTLEKINDICHPESTLDVDTEAGTVEVSWPEAEDGEEE